MARPAGPDFIIIGAMKCATSTLHDQLAAQHGFLMSEPKEPNFFSDDDVYAKGIDWYRHLFAEASPGDLRGESSTHYTKLPDHPLALQRLREHLGEDLRFVYVMRHPVDRLVSHYVHAWSENRVGRDIRVAVETLPELVDYGCYAMQLRPWLDVFGPGRILPVFFERMIREPQSELERICGFLGYEGQPRWREDSAPRNVSAERLRDSAWRDAVLEFPPLRWMRRRLVPQGARDAVKGLWTMRRRPEISADTRAMLERRFDADLAELGDWLGIGLECAGFKEAVVPRSLEWVAAPARGGPA